MHNISIVYIYIYIVVYGALYKRENIRSNFSGVNLNTGLL